MLRFAEVTKTVEEITRGAVAFKLKPALKANGPFALMPLVHKTILHQPQTLVENLAKPNNRIPKLNQLLIETFKINADDQSWTRKIDSMKKIETDENKRRIRGAKQNLRNNSQTHKKQET